MKRTGVTVKAAAATGTKTVVAGRQACAITDGIGRLRPSP